MTSLYIASSHAYAGKTLLALAIAQRYQEMGLRVGYFKPIGALPVLEEETHVDEDILFVKETLELEEPADVLCPLILTEEFIHSHLREEVVGLQEKLLSNYKKVCARKDLVIVGGAGQALTRGACFGLSGLEIAELLDLRTLLVGDLESLLDLDAICASARDIGPRLVGTVLNRVPADNVPFVRQEVIPHLQTKGLKVMGALPFDRLLHSISVRELQESLRAKVLCAKEHLGELVEHFRVGAMTLESALPFFRQIENKAVITGGDRSDIILAALQTSTACIILTGDLPPSPAVRVRAEELGVPILLVEEDTISTVEKVERLMSGLRVREPRKLARIKELVEESLDLTTLDQLLQPA